MKHLINIRGATACGKTTAVKQFLNRRGFDVEEVVAPTGRYKISVVRDASIIVLGDYSASGNCLGPDRFKNGKSDIMDCIVAVCEKYNPNIIIYEHMLSSNAFKGTNETASLAYAYGYKYFALQFKTSESERLKRLLGRSSNAGIKQFHNHGNGRIDKVSRKLLDAGYDVVKVDVSFVKKENMWKVVEYGIGEAIKRVC